MERVLPPGVNWEIIMKVFGKKSLALAVLALVGYGVAGAALAACPTDPAQPNGPWSS